MLEHGSLSLNSLANSLGNLGTRKKTFNFNVLSRNELIVILKFQRIKVGKKQSSETLINEEALLLAKFLGNEQKDWTRIPTMAN